MLIGACVINHLIIVHHYVLPADPGSGSGAGAGIQAVSGCRIKSGMTKCQNYYETIKMPHQSLERLL
jgi:hypothetical protein